MLSPFLQNRTETQRSLKPPKATCWDITGRLKYTCRNWTKPSWLGVLCSLLQPCCPFCGKRSHLQGYLNHLGGRLHSYQDSRREKNVNFCKTCTNPLIARPNITSHYLGSATWLHVKPAETRKWVLVLADLAHSRCSNFFCEIHIDVRKCRYHLGLFKYIRMSVTWLLSISVSW